MSRYIAIVRGRVRRDKSAWLTARVRYLVMALGGVMTVAGALFTLQGLGYVDGGAMSDEQFWATAGPVLAGLGVALVYVTVRGPR